MKQKCTIEDIAKRLTPEFMQVLQSLEENPRVIPDDHRALFNALYLTEYDFITKISVLSPLGCAVLEVYELFTEKKHRKKPKG